MSSHNKPYKLSGTGGIDLRALRILPECLSGISSRRMGISFPPGKAQPRPTDLRPE